MASRKTSRSRGITRASDSGVIKRDSNSGDFKPDVGVSKTTRTGSKSSIKSHGYTDRDDKGYPGDDTPLPLRSKPRKK